MFTTIKVKAAIVLTMIHLGLGFSIHAMYRLSEQTMNHSLFTHFALAIGMLYAGVLCGMFFIIKPLAPWIQRAHHMSNWRKWIMSELPTIIALIPVAFGLYHVLKAAWDELKDYQHKGKLDLVHLTALIRGVAEQAESVVKEKGNPPVKPKSKRANRQAKAA